MIHILSDSTCDLGAELISCYNIHILPLHIHLGEEEYEDGVNITPDEIYTWSNANNTTPKTSAMSLQSTMDMFRSLMKEGDEMVCFSVSESMSSSCAVMKMAAAELEMEDRIFVVDSANLSTGIGLLLLEAAEMVTQGKSAAEIAERMEQLKPLVRASFVVDTLTFLHRGGRCSSVAAIAGSMLHLHPRIAVADGRMSAGKKYRGKMESVIMTYVRDMENDLKNAKNNRVFITHSGCSEEVISSVRTYLEGLGCFAEILTTRAGGVISSHCGPGTLGVLFIANP